MCNVELDRSQSPAMQIRKLGEEMHRNNIEQAKVWSEVVERNRDFKGDCLDERVKPWAGVEEVVGGLHLFHSPNMCAAEQTATNTG